MKTVKLSIVLTCFVASSLFSQVEKYAELINRSDLKKHLEIISSDTYQGRETGKIGQQMCAEYLIKQFKELGIAAPTQNNNSYEQHYEVVESTPDGTLNLAGKNLNFREDFFYLNTNDYLSLNQLKVYGINATKFIPKEQEFALIHVLKGYRLQEEVKKITEYGTKNTKALILVCTSFKDLKMYLDQFINGSSMRLKEKKSEQNKMPIILINAESMPSLSKNYAYLNNGKKAKKFKSAVSLGMFSAELNTKQTQLRSSNVLAFIEGRDPQLKNELLVISAHYDHLGVDNGVVYNGADDDGSGTVSLIEMAQAFQQAVKDGVGPKRSILIMAFSGEEKGLLGSDYYSSHPIWPLKNTITNLNIDMIGRADDRHPKDSNYVYIIGSTMLSNDLHAISESANNRYMQMNLDYHYNSKDDPNKFYYRSDHYNFAKHNIPAIFYFAGIHEDYHQPGDDIEKIDFAKCERTARLVFFTAWELANGVKRPSLN